MFKKKRLSSNFENQSYYQLIENLNNQNKNKNINIDSDLTLLFNIIIQLIKTIFLSPIFFLFSILFLFIKIEKSKYYFKKSINNILNIFKITLEWFFQAKNTAVLLIIIWISFFIEFLFIIPKGYFNYLTYSFYDLLNGNFISIFSSIFLHADLPHIIGNSIGILIFGRVVERHLKNYTIPTFIFCAIIANLISGYIYYILGDLTPSIGASGGLAGLIILGIFLEPFLFTSIFLVPIPLFIIGWFFITLDTLAIIRNTQSQINNFAHLAGYFSLIILLFFLNINNRKKIIKGFIINLFLLIVFFIIIENQKNLNIIFSLFL
jgi:membrane associated rhomboid family serine protease